MIMLDSIKEKKLNEVGNKFEREIPSHPKEVRIVLRNVDLIDPLDIEEYITRDGYFAMQKALTELTSKDVLKTITKSGLRGRSGSGFPTGLKWSFTERVEANQKYIVCNADEGEPAAFVDKILMEKDPHAVIEGMVLAGYAVGATKGYIYIRKEYPQSIDVFEKACKQAYEYGLLGENILDSGFNFDLHVHVGAGAYICGEETSLLNSLEGLRGNSRNKPPYPASDGLWGKPTVVNNVETLANVPVILLNGDEWFRQYGTEKSPGTKVFGLTGHIKSPKLVEIPMGMTLRELIYELGEGFEEGRDFKALITSAPNFACLSKKHLDVTVEYDTMAENGCMMGSGGMIILDDQDDIVDMTKFNLEYLADESCGRCTPCRVGVKRLAEIYEKILSGKATLKDLDKAVELAHFTASSSLCGLGQATAPLILTTLDNFKDDYMEYLTKGVIEDE